MGDCEKVLGVSRVALCREASAEKGALRIHDGLRCAQDIEISTMFCILLRLFSSIGNIMLVETLFMHWSCLLLRL